MAGFFNLPKMSNAEIFIEQYPPVPGPSLAQQKAFQDYLEAGGDPSTYTYHPESLVFSEDFVDTFGIPFRTWHQWHHFMKNPYAESNPENYTIHWGCIPLFTKNASNFYDFALNVDFKAFCQMADSTCTNKGHAPMNRPTLESAWVQRAMDLCEHSFVITTRKLLENPPKMKLFENKITDEASSRKPGIHLLLYHCLHKMYTAKGIKKYWKEKPHKVGNLFLSVSRYQDNLHELFYIQDQKAEREASDAMLARLVDEDEDELMKDADTPNKDKGAIPRNMESFVVHDEGEDDVGGGNKALEEFEDRVRRHQTMFVMRPKPKQV